MNAEQRVALRSLERAFAKCAAARLAFCGMDSGLLAYDAAELAAAEVATGSLYDAQNELTNVRHTGKSVDDHGTYRDSGGW